MDAFRNLTGFDPTRPFHAWFYVLLRNRVSSSVRDKARGRKAASCPELGVGPGVSAEHLDLWRAIGRLPRDDGELIVLKHIEGWTYEELSKARRVPRGTVMSRLYGARQRLLAMLSGEEQ